MVSKVSVDETQGINNSMNKIKVSKDLTMKITKTYPCKTFSLMNYIFIYCIFQNTINVTVFKNYGFVSSKVKISKKSSAPLKLFAGKEN